MLVPRIEKEFSGNEVRINLKNNVEKDYSKIVLKSQPDPHSRSFFSLKETWFSNVSLFSREVKETKGF